MEKSFFLSSDKNPKNIQIKKEIINHFVNNGNDTIAELSKGLDLSVPTVTKLIAELTEMGLVADFGRYRPPRQIPQCLRTKSFICLFCRGRHDTASPQHRPHGF